MSQFFTSGGQSIRVSVSASVLPVNIQDWLLLGLISFRIDWLNLLAVQGLSSLLQHHSSKASILWCSAFFIVQLSHPYMTTGKTVALTRQTYVLSVAFYGLLHWDLNLDGFASMCVDVSWHYSLKQYLIFYLLWDSSTWAHVQKVSLLPPELFIDLWGNGMWSRWGFLSNGESVSSQTWPEFQNWGLWRVQNSSAVKELGSASVNKWGHTHRLHSHSAVTESNTFSFCHVLYQAPGSKDGQTQVLPSKNSKSVEAKISKQIIRMECDRDTYKIRGNRTESQWQRYHKT